MLKRALILFAESIAASRAMTITTHALIGIIAMWLGVDGVEHQKWYGPYNFIVFGWCLSQIAWTLQMPGLMRDMREIDRNRVEAQLNQIFTDALEKFKRAHGMQDDGPPPPDGRPN